MDYVIAGLAAGAVLAIAGFMLRELAMSRRWHAPAWMADAGLALMLAAVITWALTIAALASGLDDSTAATVVGAGAAVATVASLLAVSLASRSRRPGKHGEVGRVVASAAMVVEHQESRVSTDTPESDPKQVGDFVAALAVLEDAEPAAEPAPVRDARDWEEIWRETWGSGDLPRTAEARADGRVGDSEATDDETARETWAGDDAETSGDSDAASDQSQPEGNNGIDHESGIVDGETDDPDNDVLNASTGSDPPGTETPLLPFTRPLLNNGQSADEPPGESEATSSDEASVAGNRDS